MLRGTISTLALGLALWSASPSLAQDEEVANVNGVSITKSEIDAAYKRTQMSQQKDISEDKIKVYRKHVLNYLINDTLVSQFLDEQKIVADEKKVDSHIAEIRKHREAKGQTLETFLKEMGVDEKRMRSDIREIHRWMQYVEIRATNKALQGYFEANLAAFDNSEVRASHILVKLEPEASDSDRAAARKKIEAIRAQLASGVKFSDAAAKYSDCPSKSQGGDLDFFPRKGVMTEAFAATAFSLPVNQVSEIVETEFGYHLIVVTAKKPGKQVSFEQSADMVKAFYAEDLKAAIIAKARQNAKIKVMI